MHIHIQTDRQTVSQSDRQSMGCSGADSTPAGLRSCAASTNTRHQLPAQTIQSKC